MPNTTAVHIDRALSNISLFYRNPSYCADVISPPVNVAKESDRYFIYGKENFKIPPALRRDKAETEEIQYTVSSDSYLAEEYGYHELISDRERNNSDDALRPELDTTEHLTECLLLDREYRVANLILDSTNVQWGQYSTTHFSNLNAGWDDRVGADVRQDIYNAKFVVFADARKTANHIFMPVEVAYRLAQMEQVDELRKYTDNGLLTDSGIPPKLFGLRVVEAQSTYDTADEGNTNFVRSETWGNNIVIAHINPNPISLKSLTFSITFQPRPFEVRKWREEKRKSDCIEATHMYDSKIVAPACGYVYTNAITPVI
jgi:hypothetical protein